MVAIVVAIKVILILQVMVLDFNESVQAFICQGLIIDSPIVNSTYDIRRASKFLFYNFKLCL